MRSLEGTVDFDPTWTSHGEVEDFVDFLSETRHGARLRDTLIDRFCLTQSVEYSR